MLGPAKSRRYTYISGLAACLAGLGLAACEGSLSGGEGGPGGPDGMTPGMGSAGSNGVVGPQGSDCSTPRPGAAPVRRMTRAEYNNTVRDLLGDTTKPAQGFALEEEALGFNNNAANLVTSAALAEKYMLAAEGIAERATAAGSSTLGCDPVAMGNEACAKHFIESFGKRAFRRPLTPDESAMLLAQYTAGITDGDFATGIQMVIETALQSPAFLYRVEMGVAGVAGAAVRLTDWETASRLSYLLWGSMPDEALFTAAEAGKLTAPGDIEAQARRMLDDAKAHDAVENFHEQWLDYDRVANVGKDAATFPDWTAEIGSLMHEETRRFMDDAVFGASGGIDALLTSPATFLNAKLAAFYGVTGPTGEAFEKVSLDATQRAGVLTLGSLLSINAHSNQTSPVHRGKLVRERFLCANIPPPPPNVMVKAPEPDPNSTTRQRFAQHSADAACKGCHSLMDPVGFGFENYDGMGRYRTMDGALAVDASGELTATDVDGTFTGVVGLAEKLAGSNDVRKCYETQWFRFAYGRGETDSDACSLSAIDTRVQAAGGSIKELLVALTQTDAFLYRPAGGTP
jgi:hypothetical protein